MIVDKLDSGMPDALPKQIHPAASYTFCRTRATSSPNLVHMNKVSMEAYDGISDVRLMGSADTVVPEILDERRGTR